MSCLPMKVSLIACCAVVLFVCSVAPEPVATVPVVAEHMPYREAGLSNRQAAAHLLSRFSFGLRPEDIDEALAMGLDEWFEQQLSGSLPDVALDSMLGVYPTLHMTNAQLARVYPPPGKVLLELMREGVYSNVKDLQDSSNTSARRAALRYAYEHGYRPQRELLGQTLASKLLRALYSRNQLREVMTDFWMNHFSVSTVKVPARSYIMTYERDAMRPNALSTFSALLFASAKHPAMLQYLDNAQSTAAEGSPTLVSVKLDSLEHMGGIRGWFARRKIASMKNKTARMQEDALQGVPPEFRPRRGINENYARELMELHTVGVDGGYNQHDVTDAARVLSGWSMMPLGLQRDSERVADLLERSKKAGTVVQGDFLFRADAHDASAKTVMNQHFPAGGGLEEGEALLRFLSRQPGTAHRIATKLCLRFVSDQPPSALVDRVANVYLSTQGNIPSMLRCIVHSPEFWSPETLRSKIKNPFELIVSSLRACHAQVRPSKELYTWCTQLGEALYAAPAPSGYGDIASVWVNSGSLLNRMNFALALANDAIEGVRLPQDLYRAAQDSPSTTELTQRLFQELLPERDATTSLLLLAPYLNQTDSLRSKSAKSDERNVPDFTDDDTIMSDAEASWSSAPGDSQYAPASQRLSDETQGARHVENFRHVLALVLGSPEFQRR